MDQQIGSTHSLYAIYRGKTYTDITLKIRDNYIQVILHNNLGDIYTDTKNAKVFIKHYNE